MSGSAPARPHPAGSGPRDARARWVRRLDAVGLVASGFGALLLLACLVGGLVLTGGRMAEHLPYLYGHLVAWPLFTVAPWVTIALSSAALVAFVPMAALLHPEEVGRLVRAFQLCAAGCIALPFAMMLLLPTVVEREGAGLSERLPSEHWIAAAIGVLAAALMVLLAWRAVREAGRRQRAGREDQAPIG